MVPFLLPVYQTLHSASRVTVCGLAPSGSGYSAIAPVTGSILPIRLPHWPAHQMVPSGASMGSRERCPRLGTCHSLKAICARPDTGLAALRWFGGKIGRAHV